MGCVLVELEKILSNKGLYNLCEGMSGIFLFAANFITYCNMCHHFYSLLDKLAGTWHYNLYKRILWIILQS